MDNQEKLKKYGTPDDEQQSKNTHNVCWTLLYANTNNVNKTWVLLQTTGGKDVSTIKIRILNIKEHK